jgi:membrane dipeptidase
MASAAPDTKKLDSEVKAITKSAILIDTHNDIPSFTVDGTDIKNAPKNHTDIPRLRQGGVGAVFFSVYVAATYVDGNHSANRALQMIDTVQHDIVGRYPNDFALALTAADIEKAHRHHKIAALMGIEGGHAIEDSLTSSARLLSARRALHDADPLEYQQLGGFIRRH